jgi:flagellar protein FlbD
MITLTRLSGSVFALNSDLIERIDSTPDTVVTLVDGHKYVVRESIAAIVDAVRDYRGGVVAASARLTESAPAAARPTPHLTAVSPLEDL